MLFTTAPFVLLFLPVALSVFFLLGRWTHAGAAAWLFAASLFFYAYWMPVFTLLLLASIVFNFLTGAGIARARSVNRRWRHWPLATVLLTLGISVNMAALCYFKYANFFVDNVNALLQTQWPAAGVILPIGISFYTFTQIAYLVDTWAGKVNEVKATHYGLFVTYFPHLIAGPVLHHAQMMPQFEDRGVYRVNSANLVAGLGIFTLGLAKKIILADGVAPYADAVFNGADGGAMPTSTEAWLGALAYTFQLYFDFSGYSDMAIGLSRMFNIQLPFNFNAPYKAINISDFWRRWHISLSTFLRDYLYVPLGGNRKGAMLRYVNLWLTMVLGGLWHGASWSFVVWGAAHGAYLMVNHAFRAVAERAGWQPFLRRSRLFVLMSWALTFAAVVAAWVLFRAHSLEGASRMLAAMVTMAGSADGPSSTMLLYWNAGLSPAVGAVWCMVLGALAFCCPNSNLLGERLLALVRRSVGARAAIGSAALVLMLFLLLVNTTRDAVSAFIYFNF